MILYFYMSFLFPLNGMVENPPPSSSKLRSIRFFHDNFSPNALVLYGKRKYHLKHRKMGKKIIFNRTYAIVML